MYTGIVVTETTGANKQVFELIWEKAVSYLAKRDYSTKSLAEKLERFTYSKKVTDICTENAVCPSELIGMIELVISRAVELGYLDEVRFARMLVRSRQSRGYGPARIRAELTEHGIEVSAELNAELVGEVSTGSDPWVVKIVDDIIRRSKWKTIEDKATQLKIRRHFYTKGFSSAQINQAITIVLNLDDQGY